MRNKNQTKQAKCQMTETNRSVTWAGQYSPTQLKVI